MEDYGFNRFNYSCDPRRKVGSPFYVCAFAQASNLPPTFPASQGLIQNQVHVILVLGHR